MFVLDSLANKQDLPNAMSVADVTARLGPFVGGAVDCPIVCIDFGGWSEELGDVR